MENHSGKNVAAGKNIGRPIIVYDDDSGEKSKPSSSSGMIFIHCKFQCIKLFYVRLKCQTNNSLTSFIDINERLKIQMIIIWGLFQLE